MKQFSCIILLFVLYGVLGSPTPDTPDWKELCIAIALIGSIGLSGIMQGAGAFKSGPYKKTAGAMQLLLYYGLTVPLILAVFKAGDFVFIIRDLIGFLFLLLPLFFLPLLCEGKTIKAQGVERIMTYGAIFIGLCFALRVLFPQITRDEDLLYLANSPLVIFCAIFCLGKAFTILSDAPTLKSIYSLSFYIFGAVITVLAMLNDAQRAPMIAMALSLGFIAINQFMITPKKIIFPLIVIGASVSAAWPYLYEVMGMLAYKTSLVGFNMRSQELSAVWHVLIQNPQNFLFGIGWGGQFESPAVGNLNVTFTHSLLSYMALKTGFVGLVLTFIYIGVISHHGAKVIFKDRVVGIALLWGFIIPIFLYASYKSLDFGLLLTLILALSVYRQQTENKKLSK